MAKRKRANGNGAPPRLELVRPDDWHLHLRDGAAMAAVLPHTLRCFARAIVMPNLTPPVTTLALARAYRERILAALPAEAEFTPLMTLYLTDDTRPDELREAAESTEVIAVKLYPAGATTNSESGVTNIEHVYDALEVLAETGMPLLVHGEVTDPEVDVFDREQVFIERVLEPMRRRFPALRVVFEHVTSAAAVAYVRSAPANLGATITPQHLLLARNALFEGGLRPHHYCLPVLKTETDRRVLLEAATSGDPRFFLGTDSAPHARGAKECDRGCAGVYTAHAALELYAEAFESVDALDRLEAFASFHGPDFYRLPRNVGRLELEQRVWTVPLGYAFGRAELVPFRAGQQLAWRVL